MALANSISNPEYRQFVQQKSAITDSSGFAAANINSKLFDFQQAIVAWACERGKAAIFADTGLGKTFMQCEWARLVHEHTGGNVLILAPLCVAQQTVKEAAKLDISVNYCRDQNQVGAGITISNYEMINHFDASAFIGIVLDESSILKHQDSKTRQRIIETFRETPYRLSCTATPSPNDFMELGNQSDFLGIMTPAEMLAMFFVHDGGETQSWRLKGHGKNRFWEWMATWSICIRSPADIGFDGSRFILPELSIIDHVIEVDQPGNGELFVKPARTLTERRDAKKESLSERVELAAQIVNDSTDHFIIWCHLNDESSGLAKRIPDAVEVTGSMSPAEKEKRIMAFTNGESRVIVTKPSIAGFGLNWQHCARMIFVGLNDSYESYYQAIRRCYRFGQTRDVQVHLVSADSEGAVKQNLERKQAQADEMSDAMVSRMKELTKIKITGAAMEKAEYKEKILVESHFTAHLGDCVEVAGRLDDDSIDYSIFSPPFASLYTYSNSDRDMGNCRDKTEFYEHFLFLVKELFRVIKPGRLVSFHCMNLPTSKFRDGFIGVYDFRGELIRMFVDAGFIFHSEVCIWKDPVTAMQRTKAIGLLYKQLKKDSTLSRQGIPDYLVSMRKPGVNAEPVSHTPDDFPVHVWQRHASPVWMDINPSRTLQYRQAREENDERHIAPLQLDVIERAVELWSNPDDLVLSPFMGIGSEGFVSLKMGRRFVGIELKESYFDVACRNLKDAKQEQRDLFSEAS